MTNTATKTYRVAVIERALAYYEVEAEGPRDAAENWSDGEFRDRDDEALGSEGPCNVRERQPDGTWRIVPPSEWEDAPPAATAAPARDTRSHTPPPWHIAKGTDGAVIYSDHATIANVPIDLIAWEANACLIAAAPKSLAACRMVVERWERGDLAEAGACGEAIAEVETALLPSPGDSAKRPYSVLLLYPEYANDGGSETYYAWVEAPDSLAAVAEAQRQALAVNEWEDTDPADFAPLLVVEGHHYGQPMSND